MSRTTLNLGILAHVDAGKTTLTERLLHAAGVIENVGSVDKGTTHTDWLPLERERRITIKSAVVSFTMEDIVVNLIDTPGHPDFIAEVERVLGVLDGVVLVVSAVEGVQPQTRLLMRVLKRLGLPTLIFVNKIDRMGARPDEVVASIRRRLRIEAVPLGSVSDPGSRAAQFVPFSEADPAFLDDLAADLAQRDEGVFAVLDDTGVAPSLRAELVRQSKAALVHPLLFGSALSGAGISALTKAIAAFLPTRAGDADAPLAGSVFKIERSPAGERLAYLRLSAGTVRIRERVSFAGDNQEKVTGIAVFSEGELVTRPALAAGEIGKISGLKRVRTGDVLGVSDRERTTGRFAPPTLLTRVVSARDRDGRALVAALTELAEQDPLIAVRHDPRSGEVSVSLYGEVQKEVLQATLEREYGIPANFQAVTPLCVERPAGVGEAVEVMHGPANPFDATIGLRVAPGPPASGVVFRLEADPMTIPLFLFKTLENFTTHLETWVAETLMEGLHGWAVTDCVVTMFRCLYGVADGPPSRRGSTTTTDFRLLTPIVTMEALRAAGSRVCEPMVSATLEVPAGSVQGVLSELGRRGASIDAVTAETELCLIRATLTSTEAVDVQRRLPELTGGEGVVETTFGGYRPCAGEGPRRPRTMVDPLDRKTYLAALGRRV